METDSPALEQAHSGCLACDCDEQQQEKMENLLLQRAIFDPNQCAKVGLEVLRIFPLSWNGQPVTTELDK